MGVDYSGCCVGYERGKAPKHSLIWQNSHGIQSATPGGNPTNVLTSEEAQMMKKQELLNLHLVQATKLKQKIEACLEDEIDVDVSQAAFCAILADSKLLRADFPTTDARWKKFYSRFMVMDYSSPSESGEALQRYCMVPVLIALVFLSQGSTEVKAKAMSEVFSGRQLLKKERRGIRASKEKDHHASGMKSPERSRSTLDEQTKVTILTKEQLQCIIQVIVSVCLVMLPIFASNSDEANQSGYSSRNLKYVKMQIQWNQKKQLVADKIFNHFKTVARNNQYQVTVRQFIDKAKQIDLFNVMMIRQLAKNTQIINNYNPNINKETALQRDIFDGRASETELNDTILYETEEPKIFASAALYVIQPPQVDEIPVLPKQHERKKSYHKRTSSTLDQQAQTASAAASFTSQKTMESQRHK